MPLKRSQDHPLLFVAIAWLELEGERRYRVLLGSHDEIAATLVGESVAGASFVSIARALPALRANAQRANIALPQRLTVAEDDKPAYDLWRAEITQYQAAAGARLAKAKSKSLVKA